MTSLWRNFSGNVVANSKWSRLLISASEVHWRVQPTDADSTRCMGLCTHCTCLNNASRRTVRKLSKRNNGHLITLQILIPWRYVCGATHEAILKPSEPKTVSEWIKRRTGEDMRQFSAGINKAVPSFRNNLTRVCEWWRKTLWALFYTQKSVHMVFAISRIV